MNKYLLFEIGVEELPARFVNSSIEQLENNLTKALNENRITFDKVNVYSTPRRLTVIVDNISDKQPDLEEEVKGPAKRIALDAEGNPTKPLLGFMNSKCIKQEDLYFNFHISWNTDLYSYYVIFEPKTVPEDLMCNVKSVIQPIDY